MQLANIFTKPLGEDQFYFNRREMRMINHIARIKGESFLLILYVANKLIFKASDFDNIDYVKVVEFKSLHTLIWTHSLVDKSN